MLVGIEQRDTEDDVMYCSKKLCSLRLWPDDRGRPWNNDVMKNKFGLLLVSQFTLHGVLKGNRPDFHRSMEPVRAEKMFNDFVEACRVKHTKVETGRFGAMMEVSLVNDGPVTIVLDSQEIGFKRKIKIDNGDSRGKNAPESSSEGTEASKISKKERKRARREAFLKKVRATCEDLEMQINSLQNKLVRCTSDGSDKSEYELELSKLSSNLAHQQSLLKH